jgi:hypothetical protein
MTRRSIDWKLVGYAFEPPHARFNFTLEGCAYAEGFNSHGDLPQCSWSYSILERDFSGAERVFINPPMESWHDRSVIILRVVGVQLRHLRWLCSFFLLSGLSSTSSLDTGKSTKNSQRGHICLLASRWTILFSKGWLLQLHGMFNFG